MNKWKRIRPYIAFCAIALAVGGDEADARAKAGNVAESLDIAIV